jgi:hypothetical protein
VKRRLLLAAIVASAFALPAAAPATAASGAWACAAVDAVDKGVCVYDPIPPPPREHVPDGL